MIKRSLKIALAGGGTGGHFFPALHLARAIGQKWDSRFLFFGAPRGIESRKAPEAGFDLVTLPVSGFRRSISADNLAFPFKLWKSIRLSRQTLNRFKPDLVIGTGGYVMGPVLYAAQKLGLPTVIQEQNSYPGVTTRLLAARAHLLFLAYEEAIDFLKADRAKILLTGNPLSLSREMSHREALAHFNLAPDKKTILVFGGSQGAHHINLALQSLLKAGKLTEEYQILWQSGPQDFEDCRAFAQTQALMNVQVLPFIEKMAEAYALADFAVCRSGAMTLSELMAAGLPAILVPLPTAAADHQYKNALALKKRKAALIVRDDNELEQNLQQAIFKLQSDSALLKTMAVNIKKMHQPDTIPLMLKSIAQLLSLDY